MNEDYHNETFDYTILVPVTVGLGSILASFLQYKYGLFCSAINKHSNEAKCFEESNRETNRLNTIRKKVKSNGKNEQIKTVEPVETKVIVKPEIETIAPMKSLDCTQEKFENLSKRLCDQILTESIHDNAKTKKLKKPKRSLIKSVEVEPVTEPVEVDSSWVTVMSKKNKHLLDKNTPKPEQKATKSKPTDGKVKITIFETLVNLVIYNFILY